MKNLSQATSTQDGGGCFSLILYPPITVVMVGFILVLLLGNTSLPSTESAPISNSYQGLISPLFTPEVLHWERDIVRWANEWGLDPNMVATVMQIESCGSPLVTSSAGAIGLFQVMPYHFEKSDYPYSPNTNASRGLAYLRQALDRYNDPRRAFAGYNGGITNAGRPEFEWPSETIRYTYWGFNIYMDTLAGKTESATLQDWLQQGGTVLCSTARKHLGLGG